MRVIDGDALLRELKEANILSFYELNEHSNEAYKEFKALIEHAPTIESERKRGKWIEYIPGHGKCPFCGNQVDLLGGKANNFCGECGADMRERLEE